MNTNLKKNHNQPQQQTSKFTKRLPTSQPTLQHPAPHSIQHLADSMGLNRKMFESPVPTDLLCALCGQVLVQPELSVTCQHAFCSSCLQENVATPCPSCGKCLESVPRRPAPAHTRLRLLELKIHCDHKCGQVLPLGQLPNHVTHVCPNTPVNCEFAPAGCRKKVRRCDATEHAQECDFRPVTCDACGHLTLFRDLHVHQSRKRCVEMRIKNQLIRAVRSTRKEVKRHQNHLQRQQVRSDQFHRRLELEHTKRLSTARRQRQMQKNYNLDPEDIHHSNPQHHRDHSLDPFNTSSTSMITGHPSTHNDHVTATDSHHPAHGAAIPTISFMSARDHTANQLLTAKAGRDANRSSEPSRISMSREIGHLASPRDVSSRERPGEQQAQSQVAPRVSVSRERSSGQVPASRIVTSRERSSGQVPAGRIVTSRERHDQLMTRLNAGREKFGQAGITQQQHQQNQHQHPQQQQQQPQELFLTSAMEFDDAVASVLSSSDLEVHNCRNCKRSFRESRNKANSCRWHAGPIIELFGGTCYSCGRLDYQKGCMMGRHEL